MLAKIRIVSEAVKNLAVTLFLTIASILMQGCSRLPDKVLSEDEMASLLFDMYKGESVIDIERSRYYPDSMKKVVQQSVYARHGVSQEIVDSSYNWYGHHLEDYIKVHDRVIEMLEQDLIAETGNKIIYAEGDSIDLWPGERGYRITSKTPSDNIAFSINIDDNSLPGDNYQLQFKLLSSLNESQLLSFITAEYEDGNIEYKYAGTTSDGWTRIRFVTDSSRIAARVNGAITFDVPENVTVYLDSVALVRTRNQKSTYSLRYGQRRLKRFAEKESIDAE